MFLFFFFKQKTAYEMRISDWSSDVCSSDLLTEGIQLLHRDHGRRRGAVIQHGERVRGALRGRHPDPRIHDTAGRAGRPAPRPGRLQELRSDLLRSEEHTSELQSLMRISYAVFCLKKKK